MGFRRGGDRWVYRYRSLSDIALGWSDVTGAVDVGDSAMFQVGNEDGIRGALLNLGTGLDADGFVSDAGAQLLSLTLQQFDDSPDSSYASLYAGADRLFIYAVGAGPETANADVYLSNFVGDDDTGRGYFFLTLPHEAPADLPSPDGAALWINPANGKVMLSARVNNGSIQSAELGTLA